MALTNPNTPVSEQDLHDFYNRIKPYLGGGGGGGSLPAGGTTGQSLVKHSDSDNDAEWFDVNKEISFDDFNELTQEEKDNGTSYYIPDATVVSNLTVMGNRFDKANIYTTTERMIGSWMGKPLYQKTILTNTSFAANRWTVFANIPNIENIIDAIIHVQEQNYDYSYGIRSNYFVEISNSSDDIGIYNNTGYAVLVSYVTIQYTKTTDTTVSIGTGNDYSTDEQIIGTWIDGKPLYQKTFNCGALPNATNKVVDNSIITNLKRVINITGYAYLAANGIHITLPYVDERVNIEQIKPVVRVDYKDGVGIRIGSDTNLSTYEESYVILQYTKTTD